jgi:hypothetical protein
MKLKVSNKQEQFQREIEKGIAEIISKYISLDKVPVAKKKKFEQYYLKSVKDIAVKTVQANNTLLAIRRTKDQNEKNQLSVQYLISSKYSAPTFGDYCLKMFGTFGNRTDDFLDESDALVRKKLKQYFPLVNYLQETHVRAYGFLCYQTYMQILLAAAKTKGLKIITYKPNPAQDFPQP